MIDFSAALCVTSEALCGKINLAFLRNLTIQKK